MPKFRPPDGAPNVKPDWVVLGELKLRPLCCAGCEPNVEAPKPPNPVDC